MTRSLSDVLRRFRPAVAPGPAGPAGVPADRIAEAEAELAVVFAALGPATAEAAEVRAAARDAADRRRQSESDEAQRIVAEARARLDEVRAEAATAALVETDAERAELLRLADLEIERMRAVPRAQLERLVSEVIDGVRATGVHRPEPTTAPDAGEIAR